jgi:cell division protein FtsB
LPSNSRELPYRRGGAVYGDLAYDLDREIRETELRHAGEKRREGARPAPQVRRVSKVQVRERQKISWTAVFGFAAVIALTILVLMSYVQLTILSSSVVDLKKQLSTLQTENVTLTAQYQQMYDLSTVKEAAEAAGMTKPTNSQIYYVDLSDGDSAVVYQQKDRGVLSRMLTSLNHEVYAVVEYFD